MGHILSPRPHALALPYAHVIPRYADSSCAARQRNAPRPYDPAGYFYEPLETLETMNFDEELKMIDICAVGPLRVSSALITGGKVSAPGGKIVMITSQGGSVAWRTVQNPTGHDYGHHMSKSAANMGGVLLAQELAPKGVLVQMLHPGFNKTDMTAKYEKVWEEEGAVDPSMGAKRVLHEVGGHSGACV